MRQRVIYEVCVSSALRAIAWVTAERGKNEREKESSSVSLHCPSSFLLSFLFSPSSFLCT